MRDLFANIENKNKRKLLDLFEANSQFMSKGSTLHSIVNHRNFIAYVSYGELKIIKNDYNGNSILLLTLEEQMTLSNKFIASSSEDYEIVASEDSQIIVIDYDTIINTQSNTLFYNVFIKNLLLISNDYINEMNKRERILSTKTIRNKLLEYFKILSKETGTSTVYLPFSYTDLADYLVADRCAMSREIKNLKDDGLIEVKGRRIKLLYYIN